MLQVTPGCTRNIQALIEFRNCCYVDSSLRFFYKHTADSVMWYLNKHKGISSSDQITWRTINANIKTHWAPLQWFLLLCWWYRSRLTVRILPVQGELGHYLNLLQPPSPLFFISLFEMVAYSASASCSSNPSSSTTGKLSMTSDGQNFLSFWNICQYHFSANAVCQHKQMESNATLLYCSCDKTEK